MQSREIKVLMGKIGLDGHDRGLAVVSLWLRDAGMEVINLGRYQTVDGMIQSAVQEDVDVIGTSFLGGEHLYFARKMLDKMRRNDVKARFVVGGIIPEEDIPLLKEMGVDGVFPTYTPMNEIVDSIRKLVGAE